MKTKRNKHQHEDKIFAGVEIGWYLEDSCKVNEYYTSKVSILEAMYHKYLVKPHPKYQTRLTVDRVKPWSFKTLDLIHVCYR